MTFIDLCAAFGRAIGRGCAALGNILARMVRLTYRYWWVVLIPSVLAIGFALYYSRTENQIYKVEAVALLNGPSIQQFEQRYAALRTQKMVPDEAAIAPYLKKRVATKFKTFRVIDCWHDEDADMIDYYRRSDPSDTVKVQMKDRLCLQFRVKNRDMAQVPEMEKAILDLLNADQAMQQSYAVYMKNLSEEVQFNHSQAHKLDSLTSEYYFNNPTVGQPDGRINNGGVSFYGDRSVRLFLKEIYKHQEHMQKVDYRMQLATAPVVLENHFAVVPDPVNGRAKCVLLFLLCGWIVGCCLAELIDKRKALSAWLKA